jgi:hypothetical protein
LHEIFIFRRFPKKSLRNPVHDPVSHSEHTFFSEIFKGPGNEAASLNCQRVFPETFHFSKGHERCSRCADVKEVFPHGCYSTPCAKSRFHCLYGNEVLNKTVKSGLTGPQRHQAERGQWLNNDDKVPYVENYKDKKKCDYQSPSSPMPKHFNVDAKYGYDTEHTNDNVSLQQYPLDYSPKNTGSPTFIKHMNESTNATNILCSPLSSTYSSVKTYSDWSTEDEYEQANYKRKPDSEYTSENRFLHPLVKFKSKHQKAENALTDLLYTVKSRNVYNQKPDCKYTVHDLECTTPNMDQRYSTENLSPTHGNCDSGTLHDAVALSADPICWYQVKYTRRTQSIRISTKLSGLPESEPRDQIHTDLQQVDGSPPSDWDSLSLNHVRIVFLSYLYIQVAHHFINFQSTAVNYLL